MSVTVGIGWFLGCVIRPWQRCRQSSLVIAARRFMWTSMTLNFYELVEPLLLLQKVVRGERGGLVLPDQTHTFMPHVLDTSRSCRNKCKRLLSYSRSYARVPSPTSCTMYAAARPHVHIKSASRRQLAPRTTFVTIILGNLCSLFPRNINVIQFIHQAFLGSRGYFL